MVISSFVLLFVSVVLCFASLRSKRGDAIGLPLIAIGTFVYLYGIQALVTLESGGGGIFLTRKQFAWAILVPAFMLPCFVWGWNRERPRFRVRRRNLWNAVRLWNYGFVTAIVGLCLYVVFLHRSGGILHAFSQVHGQAMAWQGNTAYLYDGPWWVLSGVAMMMYASSGFKLALWRKAGFTILIAALLADALLTGSRGVLFSTCGTVFVGSSIASRRTPRLKWAIAVLAVLGFAVLMMLGYRNVLNLGQGRQQTPTLGQALNFTTSISPSDIAHGTTGLEFIYHGAVLTTVDQTHKYNFGLNWIYFLVINPIPRLFWPGKHYPESPGITIDDIRETTGLNIATGSAPGIVADLYMEFGLVEAIFLYWFGKLSRRLFGAAWRLESPLAFCGYVMLYALSLNIFAQDLGPMFVSFGYSMIPIVLYTLLSRANRRHAIAFARHNDSNRAPRIPEIQCSL